MKYTQEQKDKVIRKRQSIRWEQQLKEKRIRNQFPIEVYFENGFLIIESKMNYEYVCT